MRNLILLAAIALAVAGCDPEAFTLVGTNGETAVIRLSPAAHESSKLAAQELAEYVFRISGRRMEVVTEGGGGLPAPATRDASGTVLIGTLEEFPGEVPEAIRRQLEATDNLEAYVICAQGRSLWIVGKSEVAELYATYRFLESKLGVRWFKAPTAEDPGEYVPKADSLVLGAFAEKREPKFRIRRLDKCGAAGHPVSVKAETTAVRNGYQVYPPYGARIPYDNPKDEYYGFYAPRCPRRNQPLGGGHTTFTCPMPASCFDEHPEYFALVDGQRVKGGRYCFSNPEVQKNTADYVNGLLEKNGGHGRFLFGMEDVTYGWCECDRCRALDPVPANGKSTPNVSTRFNLAVRNMADMIWAKYPEAELILWAYHTYRELPIGVRQNPKMLVQFCDHGRCYGHRFDDPSCARNVEMLKLMKGWLAVTPQVYTYEYFNCTPPKYVCHEFDEVHDLRFYASLGVMGWKNEASFSDSYFVPRRTDDDRPEQFPSNWQWLYLTGHMLWDIDQDEHAILEDAESKYYGVAYPAMRKYHALRRRLWAGNRNCMGYPTDDQRRPTLLDTPGAKEELLGYLDEAEKLSAGDALALHRVGLDRKWLIKYWIEPNEELKKLAGNTYKAVCAKGKITVDGKDDERDWTEAYSTDRLQNAYMHGKPDVPDAHKTSFGILRDDENLYFLVRAREPDRQLATKGSVWSRDGVEIFLYPPAIDNRVYHLAVDADGNVCGVKDPGGRVPGDFGAVAKANRTADGWMLEIKVPVREMHPLVPGETWKVLFGRNRANRKDFRGEGTHYTSDGCAYGNTTSYHPMEIGSANAR